MKYGRVQSGGTTWTVIAALCLLSGCFPAPAVPPTEPPLTPMSGRSAEPEQTGQQEASIEMTDQGRQRIASGRFDEAISILQKAISIHPKNSYAYYYLAQARYFKKDYGQSLPPLGQAELFLSGDPAWLARVFALRGQVFEAQARLEEANGQYQKALAADSGNSAAREGIERIHRLTAPSE